MYRKKHQSRLALLVACSCLAGCGVQTYEARLKESAEYFTYLNKVNAALTAKPWKLNESAYFQRLQGFGIEIRVPVQFTLMEEPAPQQDEQGNPIPIPPQADPRQPRYLPLQLPGLVAAWQAQVATLVGNQEQQVPAFIYLLSNHQLWLDQEKNGEVDPLSLHNDVIRRIAAALNVQAPSENYEWPWEDPEFPMGQRQYVSKKRFTTTMITSQQPINGALLDFHIYLYTIKDIQIVLLFVIPHDCDRREQLTDPLTAVDSRLAYCLEWFNADGQTPKLSKGRAAPSGF